MRRIASAFPLMLAVVAACGSPPEPAVAPEPLTPGGLEPPPVHALIGHRAALQLTSEQITTLDSIGWHLQSENQELRRRLLELRGTRPAQDPRGGTLVVPPEGRSLIEQLRQNNREAARAVHGVLSSEQQTRTCQLFREAEQRRGAARQGTGTPPGGMGPRRSPPITEEGPRSLWPWCGAEHADPH